uniref:FTH domain-containing protein n=1 Tax=Panagrolaimus sp. ES5 TaxID=591445 RepID=A0AC34GTM1_9BILA
MATEDVVESSSLNVPQQLGLPDSIMHYMKMKAPPKLLLKLMQASKYFLFKEFPYFGVKSLIYYGDSWKFFQEKGGSQILDLESLTKPLWITGSINFNTIKDEKLVSDFLSKTDVCDIKSLTTYKQIITWDQFKKLSSSGTIKSINFSESDIMYADGGIVPMDEIIKLLPKLEYIFCDNLLSTVTIESTLKFIDLLDPTTLKSIIMFEIPDSFDFKLFSAFMDANPSIDFWLDFDAGISDEYAEILQDYVDQLIQTSSYKIRRIRIRFPQISDEIPSR